MLSSNNKLPFRSVVMQIYSRSDKLKRSKKKLRFLFFINNQLYSWKERRWAESIPYFRPCLYFLRYSNTNILQSCSFFNRNSRSWWHYNWCASENNRKDMGQYTISFLFFQPFFLFSWKIYRLSYKRPYLKYFIIVQFK